MAHHYIHARVEHPMATRHGERQRFVHTSVHTQIELKRAVGGWNRTNKNKNKPSSKQTPQDKQKRYISITVRFTNVRYILQQQTHKINVTHQQIRPRQRILGDSEHKATIREEKKQRTGMRRDFVRGSRLERRRGTINSWCRGKRFCRNSQEQQKINNNN